MKYTYNSTPVYKSLPVINGQYRGGQYVYDSKMKCVECNMTPKASQKKELEKQAFGNEYREGSVGSGASAYAPNSAHRTNLATLIAQHRTLAEKKLWEHVHLRGGDSQSENVSQTTMNLLQQPYAYRLFQKKEECKTCMCQPTETESLDALAIGTAFVDRVGWKTLELGSIDVRMWLKKSLTQK